jgi:hypothetical protein
MPTDRSTDARPFFFKAPQPRPSRVVRSWQPEMGGLRLFWQPGEFLRTSRYLPWSEVERFEIKPMRFHQLGRASYGTGLNWCELHVVRHGRYDFPLERQILELNASSEQALLDLRRQFRAHRGEDRRPSDVRAR